MTRTEPKFILFSTKMLGDALVQTAVFHNIRLEFPKAKMVFVCPPKVAVPLEDGRVCDELWAWEKRGQNRFGSFFRMLRRIRREKFTHAVIFDPNDRAAVWSFLGGIKIRAGLGTQTFSFLLNRKSPLREAEGDFLVQYLDVLKVTGVPIRRPLPFYSVPRAILSKAQADLRAAKLFGKKIIVCHIGASEAGRQWLPEKFARMAELLLVRNAALRFIFIGGPGEHALLDGIRHALGKKYDSRVLFEGECTLSRAAAFISFAALAITHDSAPRHLAAAVRTKTVSLLSSWKKKTWELYTEDQGHYVVYHESPEPLHAIGEIPVGSVVSAVKKILKLR